MEAYFKENIDDISGGAAYSALTIVKLKEIEIPLPPLEIQEQIVKEIEGYQKEITDLKEQIIQKELKIKDKINEVWGVKEV